MIRIFITATIMLCIKDVRGQFPGLPAWNNITGAFNPSAVAGIFNPEQIAQQIISSVPGNATSIISQANSAAQSGANAANNWISGVGTNPIAGIFNPGQIANGGLANASSIISQANSAAQSGANAANNLINGFGGNNSATQAISQGIEQINSQITQAQAAINSSLPFPTGK